MEMARMAVLGLRCSKLLDTQPLLLMGARLCLCKSHHYVWKLGS